MLKFKGSAKRGRVSRPSCSKPLSPSAVGEDQSFDLALARLALSPALTVSDRNDALMSLNAVRREISADLDGCEGTTALLVENAALAFVETRRYAQLAWAAADEGAHRASVSLEKLQHRAHQRFMEAIRELRRTQPGNVSITVGEIKNANLGSQSLSGADVVS